MSIERSFQGQMSPIIKLKYYKRDTSQSVKED